MRWVGEGMQPERVTRIARLYDVYGSALTDRQREVLELVCLEDLSLGEVAGHLGISRQGVHDLVRRAEAALEDYEGRLGFASRLTRQRRALLRLQALLEDAVARHPSEAGLSAALNLVREIAGSDLSRTPPGGAS